MLTFHQLLLFVVATAALALSPGPNQAYMLSRTLSQGRAAGIVALLGVETGFTVHLFAAAFGLTAFLLVVPVAYNALRLLGAGYLLYLAWRTVRGSGAFAALKRPVSADTPGRLYRMGFVSNALNPKTAMFYLSIFPQFIGPMRGSVLGPSIVLGLIHIAVSTACNLLVIFTAGIIASRLQRQPVWERIQRWLFGGLLAGFAIKLALEERR
ncbi:MAG: LysE family translocator [Chthoniobacterales bacterium]|jgi:threonine/homoserine/homoserine lactone efflux protein|nr:LysE family translocator [Chthoniobacterales bacterium]